MHNPRDIIICYRLTSVRTKEKRLQPIDNYENKHIATQPGTTSQKRHNPGRSIRRKRTSSKKKSTDIELQERKVLRDAKDPRKASQEVIT
jgi:hypothetical protein